MIIRLSSASRTRYTYTCKQCGHKCEVVFSGVFEPLAEYWAFARLFAHSLTHHREAWDVRVLASGIKKLLCGTLCTVIVLIHAATYVFYPLYALLRWLYE